LNLAAAVNIVLYDRQAKLGTGVEPKTHLLTAATRGSDNDRGAR
jgi:hypothetical protein